MEDRHAARRAAAPPDLNAETHPFGLVQRLLDEAAYFSLYSTPAPGGGAVGSAAGGGVVGVDVRERLHPFHVAVRTDGGSVRADNRAGSALAECRSRWMFVPDDFRALPGRPVPAARFDPSRPQRFAMLDAELRFLDGEDGFRGFGTGATFPAPRGGGVAAAAVGTSIEGRGRFRGLAATYTYCGTLDPERGFRGHLMLRVMDPDRRLSGSPGESSAGDGDDIEPGTTYLLVRGQKESPAVRTHYDLGPAGNVEGFHLEQELRALALGVRRGGAGPVAWARVEERLGTMRSQVFLDILDPGAPGTDVSPIPFTTVNRYRFLDGAGREVGSVGARGGEGRSFQAVLAGAPGQQALRFGAFQPLADGAGCLAGVRGLLTDNSVVGVAPHATSTLYVLRIDDPERRLRLARGV